MEIFGYLVDEDIVLCYTLNKEKSCFRFYSFTKKGKGFLCLQY